MRAGVDAVTNLGHRYLAFSRQGLRPLMDMLMWDLLIQTLVSQHSYFRQLCCRQAIATVSTLKAHTASFAPRASYKVNLNGLTLQQEQKEAARVSVGSPLAGNPPLQATCLLPKSSEGQFSVW